MRYKNFTSFLARLVPPRREIIFRSGGQMRYFGVGRFGQVSLMFLATLFVGWVGVSSAQYVINGFIVAERNVRIATTDRIVRNMQEEIDDLKRELELGSSSIDEQAAARKEIQNKNSDLRKRIANLETERDRLAQIRDHKDEELAQLSEKLAESESGQDGLSDKLNEVEKRFDATRDEREKLANKTKTASTQIGRLNAQISELTEERKNLAKELAEALETMTTAVEERDTASSQRGKLDERVAVLSERLELFEATQTESIDRLGAGTEQGIGALEQTLVVAGLEIPLMLERVLGENPETSEGVGGPFLALEDEPGSEAGEKLATVERRLLRLQGLQGLMKQLPFAAPLDEYRLSSGFGRRRDPFTNRLAMHPGLDFASRSKNSVRVTAPGTVAFVGWKGGYGKVVEVDHGLGVRTRYAHLSRIYVKRRQKLEFREKVGQVGSTGRSTAPHLHYEIMVDGQQLDPANFLRAGQYVFKN